MLQCHLQLARSGREGKGREGKGREGKGREQHRAGGQTRAVAFHSLSPWDHRVFPLLPSPMHLFQCVCVCECVCPCKRVQRAQRTRRKGERMRGVGGRDSLVFVSVCVAFSLLWLTTKIPHCSSLADMAFSFPFELSPPAPPSPLPLPNSPPLRKFCSPLLYFNIILSFST